MSKKIVKPFFRTNNKWRPNPTANYLKRDQGIFIKETAGKYNEQVNSSTSASNKPPAGWAVLVL